MANKITWAGAATSKADVILVADITGVGTSQWTSPSTTYDNTSNLDQYGTLRIFLASASSAAFTPGTGAYLGIYLLQSLDGTNYDPVPSTGNPSYQCNITNVSISSAAAATSGVLVHTPWFRLPPCKMEFSLLLATSGKPSSSSTLSVATLYTQDDQVN